MVGATWNCCRLGARFVYTTQLWTIYSIISFKVIYVGFICNLAPTLLGLAEWPWSATCCCGNAGVERIPKWVSTERWPWRRNLWAGLSPQLLHYVAERRGNSLQLQKMHAHLYLHWPPVCFFFVFFCRFVCLNSVIIFMRGGGAERPLSFDVFSLGQLLNNQTEYSRSM